MPRPVPPPSQPILRRAQKLCSKIGTQTGDLEELYAERRKLWTEAADAGASLSAIAETCGVAPQLVNREVSRQRGTAWAAR